MKLIFGGGTARLWFGGNVWFRIWWRNFLGVNKVLDSMAEAKAIVGRVAMTLVVFAILGLVIVSGQDSWWRRWR